MAAALKMREAGGRQQHAEGPLGKSCDVLVIGSGPLGAATARRLANNGRDVLMIEQGPALSEPAGSHLRNARRFRDAPDSYLPEATSYLEFFDTTVERDHLPGAAVTRARGGQGIIWTNLCPRGDVPWDALTTAEWKTYYDIAEGYLGVQTEGFERSLRQQRIRARLSEVLSPAGRTIEALPVAARFGPSDHLTFTAPYDILSGTERQVTVSSGTAHKILATGTRATGAIVDDETVVAEDIVVAAGAIGTPQLLHRSDIRPKALGRWLSYHPLLVAQLVLDEFLCAVPGVHDREPRLQIRPAGETDWYTLVLRDVSPFEPASPDIAIDPNRLVELQMICPVDPDQGKRIIFDDNSRPTFDVALTEEDQARMANAVADCDALTAHLGRYRAGCRPQWMPFGFAHMTGTTRMSAEDDGTGVTDHDGRVWGYDNLYLATNGLIPTRMAVNPTLTGVALGVFVADRVCQ
ncbi:FAD-dependent oxidoreductase [Roseibium sp. M-1]